MSGHANDASRPAVDGDADALANSRNVHLPDAEQAEPKAAAKRLGARVWAIAHREADTAKGLYFALPGKKG